MQRWLPVALLLALIAGCAERSERGSPSPIGSDDDPVSCIDDDEDGFGLGCLSGPDCDDRDPNVFADCLQCAAPDEGCACEPGSQAVSCYLDKIEAEDGTLLCQEGTRYCRSGVWSSCEGIHVYPVPQRDDSLAALIDPDASPTQCSDCNVKCFVIRDNLDPTDSGFGDAGDGVSSSSGGGLTLAPTAVVWNPNGTSTIDGGTIDGPLECTVGTGDDYDCDGIPDTFDSYPFDRPFATTNPAIFLDLAPGETGTGTINLRFFMKSIDAYFMLDQTDSMQAVRRKLETAISQGTFLGADVECADTDLDGNPNNELKALGLIGGIRCLLRDAFFGVGFLREIPFTTYGDSDEITYRHVQDMTQDTAATLTALESMSINRDTDWPDAHPLALYSLATGNGLYMGMDKPGVPPRVGCPEAKWGYACFRDDALPVVLMFTDSPMHEGPPIAARDFDYDSSILTITTGTGSTYVPVQPTNDVFSTAHAMGDITETHLTYAGTTTGLLSDYNRATMSCLTAGNEASPDATFTFSVSEPTTVTASTANTSFASAVAIYNHVVESPVSQTSPNTNETSRTTFELGSATDNWIEVTGDTAAMAADYAGAYLGCGAADSAADAVFGFSLARTGSVRIDTAGTAFDGVISLHDQPPALLETLSTTNVNDEMATATSLGQLDGRILEVTGGNTSATGITANYTDEQMGCDAASASPDAVYSFSVAEQSLVRLETTGSSFDTVLSLADGMLGAQQPLVCPASAEKQEMAYEVGDLIGKWYGVSGSTGGMNADYRASFIGCNANTYSSDAVMKFSLSQPTTVRLNTVGSAFDTVISLHDGVIDPTTPLTTNNMNETAETPMVLGTVDDAWFEIFGGNTTNMVEHYTETMVGCGADTFSPDAVFAFNVVTDSRVRIDTVGSTFNTVLSLHRDPPPRTTTTVVPAGSEFFDVGDITESSTIFTGSSVGLSSDYGGLAMGCYTEDAPPDVQFQFTLSTPTQVEINTEQSDFDTSIGLYPATVLDPKKPAAVAVANTNESNPSAYDVGVLDGQWKVFSGDSTNMSADFGPFGCGVANAARDAVFKFTLTSRRTVTIDTIGSATDMVLGLYEHGANAYISCNSNGGGGTIDVITATLDPGTYQIVVKGNRSTSRGAYQVSFRDNVLINPIGCNDDAFISGRSRVTAFLLAGTYNVVLKGARATNASGNYAVRFTDSDWFAITNRIACDDNNGGGTASMIEQDLTPGTYYIVLKGDLAVDKGPYMLTVRSISSSEATNHGIACDDNGAGGTASLIETTLDAGEYWVVVKGTANSANGPFELEMRDIGAGGQGLVLACNDDVSGTDTSSVIERSLAPGNYYVFVKGDNDADRGAYSLRIRDVNSGGAPLACDAAGGGAAAQLDANDLAAGDYWVIMKGATASSEGAYKLAVRDTAAATRTQYACTTGSSVSTALAPGTYDVVLKGTDSALHGNYELTLGNGETHSATFVPPTWTQTLNAMQDRDMRVITVLNCHDNGQHGEGRDCDWAREQAVDMANATDALGPNLEPLVVDIDANGTGLEAAVMNQLTMLSGHLQMNVSVRIAFDPDANPGFIVSVVAIDTPGDGCDGLVGITHLNCRPGATPMFHVNITNPADNPVPLNPDDPNGGYNFRADLIADGKYFVDAVPIYVIPEDVIENPDPPEYVLEPTGTYTQTLSSGGCTGNERPDWQDLFWTATMPSGTSIAFAACTGGTDAELAACTLTPLARVVGGAACTLDSECPGGHCAANGVCQRITSGTCLDNTQCGVGATCDTALATCVYSGQPVYVGALLGQSNLETNLRMEIGLNANVATNDGPSVHDWSISYLCRNVN